MHEWVHQQWKPACDGDMLLALDVHKAQRTDAIQDCLRKDCKTEPVFVPASTTSLVQPVDVVFNAPFKAAVEGGNQAPSRELEQLCGGKNQ